MQHLSVEDRDNERWITLRGELDQQEILDLKARFDKAIETAPRDVVVDMTAIAFIGTLGIGLITSACDALKKRGSTLRLHGVPNSVERTLENMQLQDQFDRT